MKIRNSFTTRAQGFLAFRMNGMILSRAGRDGTRED